MTTFAYDRPMSRQSTTARASLRGNGFIFTTTTVLLVSALVKAIQPDQAVAYMGSMGYTGINYFIIAALEAASAILFLLPATRRLGLLFVSAYFGGAISAHLATHPPVSAGPGLHFLTTHPYVAVLLPITFLVSAWVGAWRDRVIG